MKSSKVLTLLGLTSATAFLSALEMQKSLAARVSEGYWLLPIPANQPPLTNNPPLPGKQLVANDDTATVEPYGSVVINVLANDSSDGLKVTNVTNGSKGSASLNKDGTVTYSPSAGIFETTDKFTYTITDRKGISATATVTMTIR